jgi:hypothetical protein
VPVDPRAITTWHLQLPTRPAVLADGTSRREVEPRQLHGVDANAGIWALKDDADWVEATEQESRLFVRTLLPAGARRRLVGGPMTARPIPNGSMAGRMYFGGEPYGYEHRLWPASIMQAPNAAYELGHPTGLGPHFGVGATWGRLDVAPPEDEKIITFLHLLLPTDRTAEVPPAVRVATDEAHVAVEIDLPDQHARVAWTLGEAPAGTVTLLDPATRAVLFEKLLATTVQPNLPIPGSGASAP